MKTLNLIKEEEALPDVWDRLSENIAKIKTIIQENQNMNENETRDIQSQSGLNSAMTGRMYSILFLVLFLLIMAVVSVIG